LRIARQGLAGGAAIDRHKHLWRRRLGSEAFQVAGRAKIMIVDPGASSCLSFDLLGFVELG